MPTDWSRRELLAILGGGALASLHAACSPATSPASGAAPADPMPVYFASLREIAALIESRDVSPVDLTELMLDRIAALDVRLHSYVMVTVDAARAAARAAEEEIGSGRYRGPLHGIPVAVKDLCYTRGVRTAGGLGVLRDFVPDHDATVVARLRDAGAVLLGKLTTTEGAMGGYHPDVAVPINPWHADYWAGVSSSGAGVAIAAGLCVAALGTDTGGSIRLPSAANGVVGLKPTYGRVSRYGVLPLAESLDHVGPMARRTADAAVVLQAIAGHDPRDPTSLQVEVPNMLAELDRGVDGLRIGFDRASATAGVDPGTIASIDEALEQLGHLGAEVVDVTLPDFSESLQRASFTILAVEARAVHAEHYPSRAEEYGPYFRDFLAIAEGMPDAAYDDAIRQKVEFSERFLAALADVDVVAGPSGRGPIVLPADVQHGGLEELNALERWDLLAPITSPANFAGTPTLSLPCGFSDDGVPHSIQLMAGPLQEPMLCRIGHAYEEATTWHTRHPSV